MSLRFETCYRFIRVKFGNTKISYDLLSHNPNIGFHDPNQLIMFSDEIYKKEYENDDKKEVHSIYEETKSSFINRGGLEKYYQYFKNKELDKNKS